MELRGAVQPGGGARSGRRRWLVAGGLAASTVGAGLLQHRTVLRQRRRAEAVDRRAAGLALPSTVVHHRIDTDDGGVVHAVEAGTGRPIVLVHGITLAAEIWSLQLAGLADRHRVVAVDLRGHGQSVPGRDGFGDGVKRLAADVRQLLDALDVTGGILVGHSLGGMTSLQLVLDAERAWLSRRLAGLALVDTSAEPLAGVRGARTARGPVTASLSRGLLLLERAGVAAAPSTDLGWWAARAAFGADPDPAHVAFTEALGRATPLGTVAGLLGPLAAFDVADRLGTIDLPTVVVVGTQDRLTPPRHARRLAEGIPGAELVELARAGHMPMLERPGELARILTDLADRVGVDA